MHPNQNDRLWYLLGSKGPKKLKIDILFSRAYNQQIQRIIKFSNHQISHHWILVARSIAAA
jgi:hypothetical protein